jgi:hypothetical protein
MEHSSIGARSRATWLFVLGLSFGLASFAAPAAAQTTVSDTGFRAQRVADDTLLHAGRWEAGFSLAATYAYARITPESGQSVAQHNVYLVPSVVGGYMVTDWLELRLTLGVQYLRTATEGGADQDIFSGVATVQALGQADFGLGVGGYVGIGLGGYYGWRNQPGTMAGTSFRFTNGGGVGQALVGLLVQPGASMMFRGGLRLDASYGGEWPDNAGLGLTSASAVNVNVLAELSLTWRFG